MRRLPSLSILLVYWGDQANLVNENNDEALDAPGEIAIETFVYPEEEFFDPVTGEPATGSPLPSPVPVTIVIPAPSPLPPPPLPPPPIEVPTLPVRPIGDFVTPTDLALALADMIVLTRSMISDALEGIQAVEGLVTQDTFQAVVRDFALVRAARVELVDAMFATQSDRFQGLESLIATTLSEIENRRLAEIAEVEEATGFTPMTIFTALGDFMRDPVNYVLEKSRDQILEEISSGLNR